MYAAGLDVEGAKGECNPGQHEIGFLYADALTTADNHAVYKTAAKEIAAQQGKAITFMAKYNEREGSSCHIHLSLRGTDGALVFWDEEADDGKGTRTPLYDHFVAGVLATLADFTLLYAPNINSYKRFAAGSFAPTTIAWGQDNRTCAVRLVGHGAGARMENRVPGADANPYLALAAMLAGGLHGIEQELTLEDELVGNAYTSDHPQVPSSLAAARERFAGSALARAAFGDEVVDHYVEHGRRRAGGLRRRGDRLGAEERIRTAVTLCDGQRTFTVINPATEQPVVDVPLTDLAGTDAAIAAVPRGLRVVARGRSRRARQRCCAGSPRSSTSTSKSWPSWRCATPATPGATPAGRPATSGTA